MKKKIVVRMPNWLGDAVMATPVLHDLKTAMPDAHCTVLCHEAIANLLQHNPYIDNFLIFSREKKRTHAEKARIFSQLQTQSFDIGILLTRSFSSAWWFYKGHVRKRIGFCDHFRSLLLTDGLKIKDTEESEHQVITYKRLLDPLKIMRSTTAPELFLQDQERKNARALLQKEGICDHHKIIGVNPGAAFGSAKCWPPEYFVELAKRFQSEPNTRLIFFSDAPGKPLVDDICEKCPTNTVNLANKTNLRSLLALISECHAFLSNDSGPMHVAAALKTPLIALFGSTNDVKTGPYGKATVIHKHVACSPCYKRSCPIDFRCMKSITVDEVVHAIQGVFSCPRPN